MLQVKIQYPLLSAKGKMLLDVDFEVSDGQLLTITGKSGSGKTTLLRIIAGLLRPDTGFVQMDDAVWLDTCHKTNCSPQERHIGFVFQNYTLFPNMTVKENLAYALSNKRERNDVDELIDIMELQELVNRKPATLSGGQQQRVALARALVRKPKLLLLDEPLSALDASMRLKLQHYIMKVHQQYNLTTLLVSHDTAEIFKMAHQVIQLCEGKITAKGKPSDVFAEHNVGGKFRFTGEIVEIEKNEVVNSVSILIGNTIVKVIATDEEMQEIIIGDKVMLVSKAFNPLIMKIKN